MGTKECCLFSGVVGKRGRLEKRSVEPNGNGRFAHRDWVALGPAAPVAVGDGGGGGGGLGRELSRNLKRKRQLNSEPRRGKKD